jgi:type I restriction enzyme S subunit
VAVLRQTILQLAVMGRLARQEMGDEPATKIVERIQNKRRETRKNERIKLPNSFKSPQDDEVPFPLPNGWVWTKIIFLADVLGGFTKNADRLTYPNKLPYLSVANVHAGELDLKMIKEIGVEENEISKYLLQDGDLLVVEGNGSINHIGRVALWNNAISSCLHQNHIIKVRFSIKEIGPFVMKWLLSKEGRNQITNVASTTSGLYTLNITKVSDLIIPLPPLAEQHRIVAKVDALMALCDALESRLKERAGVQGRLAEAVVGKFAN